MHDKFDTTVCEVMPCCEVVYGPNRFCGRPALGLVLPITYPNDELGGVVERGGRRKEDATQREEGELADSPFLSTTTAALAG